MLSQALRLDDSAAEAADDTTKYVRLGAEAVQCHVALVKAHHIVLGLHACHGEGDACYWGRVVVMVVVVIVVVGGAAGSGGAG